LRKRTQRTKPIYKLFSVIGEDKIKRIKTYSANKLSKLTDVQIDTIKKHFIAIPRDLKSRTHMTEVSTPIVSHPKEASLESVSANNISRETKILSTPQVSVQTRDHAYFRNKILGQYPDIHREFSSEKFDYYGIIDKSLCPACKSSHRDEKSIRGRYEAGSYFIKCGQQEIEITA